MTKNQRRTFTPEFKEQMVKLYENGKPKKDIVAEYQLTTTAFNNWINRSQTTGSFSEKDNRSPEENELIKLKSIFIFFAGEIIILIFITSYHLKIIFYSKYVQYLF